MQRLGRVGDHFKRGGAEARSLYVGVGVGSAAAHVARGCDEEAELGVPAPGAERGEGDGDEREPRFGLPRCDEDQHAGETKKAPVRRWIASISQLR